MGAVAGAVAGQVWGAGIGEVGNGSCETCPYVAGAGIWAASSVG